MKPDNKYVARTYASLEPLLSREIQLLGGENIEIKKRAVEFTGSKEVLYKCNLWSRFALDFLTPVSYFRARTPEELYNGVQKVLWKKFFDKDQTFSITAIVHSNHFSHSKFAALKAKDAIVDQFRKLTGERPDIDRYDADVKIVLRISHDQCHLLLNSSGAPLFKRGYREETGIAPLNEILAAAIIELSGWTPDVPFIDPMAGSGTLCIEAGLKALNIPSQYYRNEFGFEKWKNFDNELWQKIKKEASESISDKKPVILGFDCDSKVIRSAVKNLSNIPELFRLIKIENKDFFDSPSPSTDNGFVVFNPPYDKRIKLDNVEEYYNKIGSHLKHHWTNWDAWIFSSNLVAIKRLGLKPRSKHSLFNGPDECKLVHVPLYAGSKIKSNFEKS